MSTRVVGSIPERLAGYYRSPAVKQRIAEYCGLDRGASEGAWGIAGYGGIRQRHEADNGPVAVGGGGLAALYEEGADVCRSLADFGGTLIQIDIDYTNPLDPIEPHARPDRCLTAVQPVLSSVLRRLEAYAIPSITVLTGRGYHVTTRVRLGTPFHDAMVEIGRIGEPLRTKYESQEAQLAHLLDRGRAHEGAGRMLEHLAHSVIRELRGQTAFPVRLADVRSPGGGPFVCLDLSAYGDPLLERYARCAFSSNQRATMKGEGDRHPFTISLPRNGYRIETLLRVRENLEEAAALAREQGPIRIPDLPGSDLAWVRDYRGSRLARFHEDFDRDSHDDPDAWRVTYDALDLGSVPLCAALPLAYPNPLLLVPTNLRTVVLCLTGMGWSPRSVAGLIRSKYERNYGWRSRWYRYDAAGHADFYTRLFCGEVVDDIAEEMSCEAQLGLGFCPAPRCGHDVARLAATSAELLRKGD